ncbi:MULTISPECIES: hypothetical protein [Streptomyces]
MFVVRAHVRRAVAAAGLLLAVLGGLSAPASAAPGALPGAGEERPPVVCC